jgi:hypothetical protein
VTRSAADDGRTALGRRSRRTYATAFQGIVAIEGIAQPPLQFAEAFAADENAQAELFAQHGADKDLRRRAVSARHMIDIKDELSAAQVWANVTNEEIVALGIDGVTELLLDLPSRAAGHRMMWWQHDNPQTEWKPNDLNDIAYLSVAVGYCDVVVTERKWTHILNASGAAERGGTVVTSRLDDLTALLVTASLAAEAAVRGCGVGRGVPSGLRARC